MSSAYDLMTIRFRKKKHFDVFKDLIQNIKSGILSPVSKTNAFSHLPNLVRRRLDVELGNIWIGHNASDFERLNYDEGTLTIDAYIHSRVSVGGVTIERLHSLLLGVPLVTLYYMSYSTKGGGEFFFKKDQEGESWTYSNDTTKELIEEKFADDYTDQFVFDYIGQLIENGTISGIAYVVKPIENIYNSYELNEKHLTEDELRLEELKANFDKGYEIFYVRSQNGNLRKLRRTISDDPLKNLFK